MFYCNKIQKHLNRGIKTLSFLNRPTAKSCRTQSNRNIDDYAQFAGSLVNRVYRNGNIRKVLNIYNVLFVFFAACLLTK